MKKLILQVQMSVDGFVGRPNGDLDWMTWDMDDKSSNYINGLTDSVDTILLGRKMTDGFISHWLKAIADPKNPEYEFGKKMIDKPKVVFSKTLKESEWINTSLATGDVNDEVDKLKKQTGKDIIVYGGATFVSSLIRNNLIDEYHLFIHPAAIGTGLRIFGEVNGKHKLKLVKSIPFKYGVVVNHYEPIHN